MKPLKNLSNCHPERSEGSKILQNWDFSPTEEGNR